MATSVLPPYSSSSLPPSYSVIPIAGESSLALTHNRRVHHHGTFTKKCGNVSVTLTEQADDATMPVYTQRDGVVSGKIYLDGCLHISEVILKFQGRLKYSGLNTGSRYIKTVNEKYVLSHLLAPLDGAVPESIPFSVVFPSTFKDGKITAPLPPSYEIYDPPSGVSVKSEYRLKVVVKTSKIFWVHNKTLTVPLNYLQRKRPAQPILPPSSTFFSSVKTSPEEWSQISAPLKTYQWSSLAHLQAHFFLPTIRVFALRDTIPFHIQLSGKLSSLKTVLHNLHTGEPPAQRGLFKPIDHSSITMSVTIHRQVTVKLNNQIAWNNSVIGKGKMRALPPPFDSGLTSNSRVDVDVDASESDSEEEGLDWEGEIEVNGKVQVGWFDAGNVSISDFIIFSIAGVFDTAIDFVPLEHAIPISLVTDSWTEASEVSV